MDLGNTMVNLEGIRMQAKRFELIDARHRQLLTQAQMAVKLGVTTRTVSAWENGKTHKIHPAYRDAILNAYNIPTEQTEEALREVGKGGRTSGRPRGNVPILSEGTTVEIEMQAVKSLRNLLQLPKLAELLAEGSIPTSDLLPLYRLWEQLEVAASVNGQETIN